MMKYIHYIIILVSATFFTACSKMGSSEGQPDIWGNYKSYSNFLWERYNPETERIERELNLDFNEDARKFFTGQAVLELRYQKGNSLEPTVGKMRLYKESVLCDQNRLALTVNDSIVKIGIEFNADLEPNNYTLFLVAVDNGGLDTIYNYKLGKCGVVIKKIDVMNPLAKQTMWIAIVIAALFVAWLILSRIINPYLKFSRISFDYNDGTGELSHRVGGCYKIICTNKPRRISLLHKLFVGNVHIEVNDFWSDEVTIMCGSRNNIRLITRGDYILPDEPVRKELFIIQDGQQRKVNIETT